MSKATATRVTPATDDDEDGAPALPRGVKNYMTPAGYARMKDELTHLLNSERPELVKVVAWAASNGDRSENGDYLYGKKRLREIDRRIRYLTRRLDNSEVVDPAARGDTEQVFFGATVTYADTAGAGAEQTVTIVGLDEVDPARGRVSWVSPIASALIKHSVGDTVMLRTPAGPRQIEIVDVRYEGLT
ncbi:MAG: transcription elongation factor GreB [Betaproteobacteria bacterium]|nr:transcription elongation factor GreB [Betaproteobacteria bacterium]